MLHTMQLMMMTMTDWGEANASGGSLPSTLQFFFSNTSPGPVMVFETSGGHDMKPFNLDGA